MKRSAQHVLHWILWKSLAEERSGRGAFSQIHRVFIDKYRIKNRFRRHHAESVSRMDVEGQSVDGLWRNKRSFVEMSVAGTVRNSPRALKSRKFLCESAETPLSAQKTLGIDGAVPAWGSFLGAFWTVGQVDGVRRELW